MSTCLVFLHDCEKYFARARSERPVSRAASALPLLPGERHGATNEAAPPQAEGPRLKPGFGARLASLMDAGAAVHRGGPLDRRARVRRPKLHFVGRAHHLVFEGQGWNTC